MTTTRADIRTDPSAPTLAKSFLGGAGLLALVLGAGVVFFAVTVQHRAPSAFHASPIWGVSLDAPFFRYIRANVCYCLPVKAVPLFLVAALTSRDRERRKPLVAILLASLFGFALLIAKRKHLADAGGMTMLDSAPVQ